MGKNPLSKSIKLIELTYFLGWLILPNSLSQTVIQKFCCVFSLIFHIWISINRTRMNQSIKFYTKFFRLKMLKFRYFVLIISFYVNLTTNKLWTINGSLCCSVWRLFLCTNRTRDHKYYSNQLLWVFKRKICLFWHEEPLIILAFKCYWDPFSQTINVIETQGKKFKVFIKNICIVIFSNKRNK